MTGAYATDSILIAASEVDERLLECLASCRATFVRTFEDAQRALREQLFRLIVIDLDFDDVRMFDLLQHVRSLARFNGVPVLCVQGSAGGAGITAALDRVVRMLGELIDMERRRSMQAGRDEAGLRPTRLPERRLCILIIDRDVDAANRLGELLEQLGHDVDLAYDGCAGLDAARRLRPDAVFIDLALLRRDGYRLARRLRRESGRCDIRLVGLTSAPNEEDRRHLREAGFDHLLAKPADRQSVLSLLESCRAHEAG